MKLIVFDKLFVKHFRLRISNNSKILKQYNKRYRLFCLDQRGSPLDDHALIGPKRGQRAFSISGDIRVLYIETDEAIIFLDIGTHNQVY